MMFQIFRRPGLLAVLLAGLLVFVPFLPIRAETADFATLIGRLGADNYADKIAAVEGLSDLGDGRAVPALKALADGRLNVRTSDGKVVIADPAGPGFRLIDAANGGELGGAVAADLDKVRINNRLRSVIDAAMARLALFAPDPALRLTAARDSLKHATPALAPQLQKALEVETNSGVREALTLALSVARLSSPDKADKLKAIEGLAGSTDPQVRGMLAQARDAARQAKDTEVADAADAALRSIELRLTLIDQGVSLFQGVSLGSVLLLAAIGLAITFGVMGVINMAHGEMIMLGAYSAYVVQEIFRATLPPGMQDWYLVLAVPVGFLTAGAMGVLLERTIIRFLYGRPLETMLATWGISLMLQQLVRSIFGATNKEVANPSWMTGGFDLASGATITWNRVVIILFCLAVLGALALFLRKTGFGLHTRAVAQNRGMASVMGVPTARIDALTFGLGSGIAGIAGVALSQIGNVSPNLGQIYIVDSFLVVVFGGVGNLMGTFIGAMTLGIAAKFLEPVAGAVLGKIAVLIAIILFIQKRPRGLFALKGRAAEM